MFKQRNSGSRRSMGFAAPKIFGGTGTSSAPLLSSAQSPAGAARSPVGMYNRLSETSLNEYGSGSSGAGANQRYGPSSSTDPSPGASMTSFSSARYGPTANFSQQTSAVPTQFTVVGTGESVPFKAVAPQGPMSGIDERALDDELHTFTAADHKDLASPFTLNSWRGWANALTLFALLVGFVVLFAGYPIMDWYWKDESAMGKGKAGYNLGGTNATGQIPFIKGFPQLIDPTTPDHAMTHRAFDKTDWPLVFSDEFNTSGRTFYPGDDPFFTAVDLRYWPTNDFEWYDPGQVTTKDGHLLITMEQQPTHNLMFKSGMIQSWNQLCFNKNAYIEVSVSLPGTPQVGGFWPGVWTLGNLARAGYGGTTEGLWPYSYNDCDIGILPNQTWLNGTGPEVAFTTGDNSYEQQLSYLPGQRLSSCNCPGTDHPGPPGVGRGGVEIDIIEAQMNLTIHRGQVSQSAQFAPYDDYYQFDNSSDAVIIYDDEVTHWNTYLGSIFQQAVSGLSYTDTSIYYLESKQFGVFGVEWNADYDHPDKGYIHWTNMGKDAWTMYPKAVGPNPRSQVGQRLISQEPMYMIFNFGMSNNFERVDFSELTFPNYMRVDYVRAYQKPGVGTIGCDPDDRPTASYIEKYLDVYTNINYTTWAQTGNPWPKNKMQGAC